MGRICTEINNKCNDIKQQQNLFLNVREGRSLVFYSEMKPELAREEYTACCSRKEGSGFAWFKDGTWKLRLVRKGLAKGKCPLCSKDENAVHILLQFLEMELKEQLLNRKWLALNEKLTYKKIKNHTHALELRSTGIFL